MKQKLQDFALLIRHNRFYQFVAILVFLGIMYLIITPQPVRRPPPPSASAEQQFDPTQFKNEAYESLVQAFNARLDTIGEQSEQNSQDIKEMRQSLDENTERTVEIFKKIIERMAQNEVSAVRAAQGGAGPVDIAGETAIEEVQDQDALDQFGLETVTPVEPPPPPARKVAFVGAGDSVRVRLLSGVNAPVDGSPYPVVFKLASDIYGPDGSALPVGEARIIAAAQGSLTDSRALFRLTSINVRLPDGRRKVLEVDGWVVGEDGIRGMPGVLIDPIGKAIGAAGMIGGLEGLAQGFSSAQLSRNQDEDGDYTVEMDGDTTTYAVGQGVAGAASEWKNILRDRVDQLVPQVQVLSGREATAVFSRSFTITDLFEKLEDEDNVFASLD